MSSTWSIDWNISVQRIMNFHLQTCRLNFDISICFCNNLKNKLISILLIKTFLVVYLWTYPALFCYLRSNANYSRLVRAIIPSRTSKEFYLVSRLLLLHFIRTALINFTSPKIYSIIMHTIAPSQALLVLAVDLRWLNRIMQDHEARASDLNRKLIFSFFLLFS